MAVTRDDLRGYVGANTADDAFLDDCLSTAAALVGQAIVGADVPEPVRDRAVLEAGSELFHRRQAPNGIAQYATPDGASPVRVARDPMVAARPILAPFLPPGLA